MAGVLAPVMVSIAGSAMVRPSQNGAGVRMYGATSGYVGLKPASAAGATDFTLPAADAAGCWVSNGSGVLSIEIAAATRARLGLATTDNVTFASVTGNLTGNVTGNVTGNLTGNVTGAVNGVTLTTGGSTSSFLNANGTYSTVTVPAPGGSGTELQYRSGASTFGAVTGSSFNGSTVHIDNLDITSLTFTGTAQIINTTTVEVADSLMELAVGNVADTIDSGWYSDYVATGTKYRGSFFDASVGKFRMFTGLQEEPTTTVNVAGTGYTVGTLVANLEGNVTGDLTGLVNTVNLKTDQTATKFLDGTGSYDTVGFSDLAGTLAHSSLTGLTSGDDHTQYALLVGRATPQTFAFGTASGATAGYLTSTAHATKGSYSLNSAGTIVVDELNVRIGIGVTPSTMLHIATNTTAIGIVTLEQASADTDSFDLNFRKTKGTVASPTIITTGDVLGAINAYGYSGAGGYVASSQIRFVSSGTIATTRVASSIVFATGTDAAPTVLTDRLTLNNAGLATFSGTVVCTSFSGNNDLNLSTLSTGVFRVMVNNFGSTIASMDSSGRWGFNASPTSGHSASFGSIAAASTVMTLTGATSHSATPLRVNLGATPTGNAFTITSSGGTEGDIFKIATSGGVTAVSIASGTLSVSSGTSTFNQVQIAAGSGYYWSGRSAIYSASDGNVGIWNNALTSYANLTQQHNYQYYAAADTASSVHEFYKTRGTVASPTVITTGDKLGTITGYGYSGAGGYVAGAQIRFESTGTIATTRVPGKIVFATGTDAAPTVMTDMASVTTTGINVGGSSTALSLLSVIHTSFDSGVTGITFGYDSSYYHGIKVSNSPTTANNYMGFVVNSGTGTRAERLTLRGDGRIGINVAFGSIGAQLHVVSSSSSTIGQIIAGATSHSVALLNLKMGATPTGNVFEIDTSAGSGGDLTKISSVGTFTTVGNIYSLGGSGFSRVGARLIALIDGSSTTGLAYIYSSASDLITLLDSSAGSAPSRVCLGPATTSFPALKRNGTGIDFTLGDGTGAANISAGTVTCTRVVTAAEVANTPSGTTQTINWASGPNQKLTLSSASGDVTLSYSNVPSTGSLLILFVQGATPRDVTFPANTVWDDSAGEPVWNLDTSKSRLVGVYWNGTNYYMTASDTYA